jgi:arabinose-5-phosphate isomerase
LKEICPHDLAPTTSTAIQLLFGDLLAIALMRKKSFSVADFALNHPGGLLGRRITLRVRDLMFKGIQLPKAKPTDTLIDMLHEFSSKKCGCLLVVDEMDALLGIFTDGDLRRCIQQRGPSALEGTLEMLMTKNPKSVHSDQMALEAARVMEEDPGKLITVLPVLDGKKLVGLVRMHDIVQLGLN